MHISTTTTKMILVLGLGLGLVSTGYAQSNPPGTDDETHLAPSGKGEPSAGKVLLASNTGEAFDTRKAKILIEIDERLHKLQEHKTCVSAATAAEGLKACHETMREWHKSQRMEHMEDRKERMEGRMQRMEGRMQRMKDRK